MIISQHTELFLIRCKWGDGVLRFGTEIVAIVVYSKSWCVDFYERNIVPSFDKYYKNKYDSNILKNGDSEVLESGTKSNEKEKRKI